MGEPVVSMLMGHVCGAGVKAHRCLFLSSSLIAGGWGDCMALKM